MCVLLAVSAIMQEQEARHNTTTDMNIKTQCNLDLVLGGALCVTITINRQVEMLDSSQTIGWKVPTVCACICMNFFGCM